MNKLFQTKLQKAILFKRLSATTKKHKKIFVILGIILTITVLISIPKTALMLNLEEYATSTPQFAGLGIGQPASPNVAIYSIKNGAYVEGDNVSGGDLAVVDNSVVSSNRFMSGGYFQAWQNTNFDNTGLLRGFYSGALVRSSGNITTLKGGQIIYGQAGNGTGNITDAYGLHIQSKNDLEIGTITNNNFGLYISPLFGTYRWAIYQEGSGDTNYFAGNIIAPSTYSIAVGSTNRDLYVDNAGSIGYVSSKREYKDDIKNMGNFSERIYKLNPVSFTWKKDKTEDWGLIAEDVAKIFPELASYDDKGNPETVSYQKLSVLLLNEIQKLNERIEKLEK